jgi:hypothetical protein
MPMNPELQERLDRMNAPHLPNETASQLMDPIDFSSLTMPTKGDGMSITAFMDDRLKHGFKAGEMYLIGAGFTDIPKTNFGLEMALKVSREKNIPLVFIDFESNPAIDEAKFMAAFAKLDARKIETKLIVTEERPNIDDFSDTIPGDWE